MYHRVYQSIKKTIEPQDESEFQLPIAFVEYTKEISDQEDQSYFETLLEPVNEPLTIQTIPLLSNKDKDFLFKFNHSLEVRCDELIYLLSFASKPLIVLEYHLELLNHRLKRLDVLPKLKLLEDITECLDFITEHYPGLDNLDQFTEWFKEYKPKITSKLNEFQELLHGKVILNNYERLDVNEHEEFPEGYVNNNRINFKRFIDKLSKTSVESPDRIIKNYNLKEDNKAVLENIILSNQQKFVSDYLNKNTPYRSLLLYHGLGSGKTGASISIINGFIKNKVVIMLPASLKINYLLEIEKFGESCFKSNFNWTFFELPLTKKYAFYKWITNNILKNLPNFNNSLKYNQKIHNETLEFNKETLTDQQYIHSKNILNINTALENTFLFLLNELGVDHSLLEEIKYTRGGKEGFWLIDNTFNPGDTIQNTITNELYIFNGMDKSKIYLSNINSKQKGGAKCSLCGAKGATKATCPLNPKAKKPNKKKHPEAVQKMIIDIAQKASQFARQQINELDEINFDQLPTQDIPTQVVTKTPTTKLDIKTSSDIEVPISELNRYQHFNTDTPALISSDKKSICKQIKIHFKNKCTVCSYNAGAYTVINLFQKLIPNFTELIGEKSSREITTEDINKVMTLITEGIIDNPFDNKVLVIDEIHNLISLIMPGNDNVNFNGGVLYELLMRAENLRLVCLSGTPAINDIYEFAILYNILKGLIKTFTFTISTKDALFSINESKIREFLDSSPIVERYSLHNNIMEISRVPYGFSKVFLGTNKYAGLKKNSINNINDKDFPEYFVNHFNRLFNNYILTPSKVNYYTIFNGLLDTSKKTNKRLIGDSLFVSSQVNEFKNAYVDLDDNVLYPRSFKNNIQGLTSFYHERKTDKEGNSIFPEVNITDVNLPFSMYQFIKYCAEREEERKKERMSMIQRFSASRSNIKSSFKTRTRQLSLFTFPPDILRPTKKQMHDTEYILNEIEDSIVKISQAEEIDLKTPMHEKIRDTIIEMKDVKINFVSYSVTETMLKIILDKDISDPVVFYIECIKNKTGVEDIQGDSELGKEGTLNPLKLKLNLDSLDEGQISMITNVLTKYSEFIMRLSKSIVEKTNENKNLSIDQIVTKISEYINSVSVYLTDDIDSDKEDIFNIVTKDDEYEGLLSQQISRLVDNEIYLSLNHVIKNTPYNLSWLSPKYLEIFNNLVQSPGSVFVYSQFLSAEGIGIFTEMLKKNGFKQLLWNRELESSISKKQENENCSIVNSKKSIPGTFNDYGSFTPGDLVRWTRIDSDGNEISTTHRIINIQNDSIGITKNCNLEIMYEKNDLSQFTQNNIINVPLIELSVCRYVLWTGKQTDIQERVDILKKFNSEKNKYGQDCLILLATSSGAEGISLYNVRQVHIMEPYWNNVRTKQVIGRARRIKSHIMLKKDQRNVEVFKYFSVFSSEQLDDINSDILEKEEIRTLIEDLNKLSGKESEEVAKTDSIDAFINLFNKYTREIKSIDKGKSTEDYLRFIADKKEKLLNKFLYMVKETAIDCNINLQENKASDPRTLANLECHSPDESLDGLIGNKGYTYKLNPLIRSLDTIDSDQQKERKTISQVSSKFQVLEFQLSNNDLGLDNIKLKCIVFPSNLSDKHIKNRSPLYNYYSYFGINPIQKGEKVKIGSFIDSNLELDPDFLQYVKIFEIINRLDDKLKDSEPKFMANIKENEELFEEYKNKIMSKYEEILTEERKEEVKEESEPEGTVIGNQWRCPLCDTINEDDADICVNIDCDMEKNDL